MAFFSKFAKIRLLEDNVRFFSLQKGARLFYSPSQIIKKQIPFFLTFKNQNRYTMCCAQLLKYLFFQWKNLLKFTLIKFRKISMKCHSIIIQIAKRFDSLNDNMPPTNDHFKRHSVTYEWPLNYECPLNYEWSKKTY